jgi:hypothetical protein
MALDEAVTPHSPVSRTAHGLVHLLALLGPPFLLAFRSCCPLARFVNLFMPTKIDFLSHAPDFE